MAFKAYDLTQIKDPKGDSKESPLVIFWSLFSLKSFLEVTLVSLTLRACTIFFFNYFIKKMEAISLYLFAAKQQTSRYRQQKFEWIDVKTSAEHNKISLNF